MKRTYIQPLTDIVLVRLVGSILDDPEDMPVVNSPYANPEDSFAKGNNNFFDDDGWIHYNYSPWDD